jgi:hypothetical protein
MPTGGLIAHGLAPRRSDASMLIAGCNLDGHEENEAFAPLDSDASTGDPVGLNACSRAGSTCC